MTTRQAVLGLGGIFFKARDPKGLAAWYGEHLGLPVPAGGSWAVVEPTPSPNGAPAQAVWATFASDTGYFAPSTAPFMINYRVADLDAMLAQLRAAGVAVEDRIDESEQGRFGWASDPEGNRFELWEPPPPG